MLNVINGNIWYKSFLMYHSWWVSDFQTGGNKSKGKTFSGIIHFLLNEDYQLSLFLTLQIKHLLALNPHMS